MTVSNPPRLSFVVTTLGRLEALTKLFSSIAPQLESGDELVIVAQRNEKEVDELAQAIVTAGTVISTTSSRGASLGRNAGVAASSRGDVLIFPNDTTRFPEGSITEIRNAAMKYQIVAFSVIDETGVKFNFQPKTSLINYRNAWEVIEPGLAIRRSDFNKIGGFRTDIGTGASTPHQAGEAADLLFRWQDAHTGVEARWEPSIVVCGIADSAGLTAHERRRKLRAYGRGCGHVMSMHKNPLWFRTAYIIAGLILPILRRGQYGPFDGFPAALGRFEGVTGVVFGRGYYSVNR